MCYNNQGKKKKRKKSVLFHGLCLPKEMEHFLSLDNNVVTHETWCKRFDFPIAEHACKIQLLVDILDRVL